MFFDAPILNGDLKCVWDLIAANGCQSVGIQDSRGLKGFTIKCYGIGFANNKKPGGGGVTLMVCVVSLVHTTRENTLGCMFIKPV